MPGFYGLRSGKLSASEGATMTTVETLLRDALDLPLDDIERLHAGLTALLLDAEAVEPGHAQAWADEIRSRLAEPDDDAMDWDAARPLVFRRPQ